MSGARRWGVTVLQANAEGQRLFGVSQERIDEALTRLPVVGERGTRPARPA